MSPDVLDVLAVLGLAILTSATVMAFAWWVGADRAIQPRHAARPPIGGARVAGPGTASTLADLPRIDPPITDSLLVRPYVSRHLTAVPALPATASLAAVNGRRLYHCPTCRDGASVAIDTCPLCGCPAGGWSA